MRIGVDDIEIYLEIMNTQYIKYFIITGFPGGRNTFFMMCLVFHACSKGLALVTVQFLDRRAMKLGG